MPLKELVSLLGVSRTTVWRDVAPMLEDGVLGRQGNSAQQVEPAAGWPRLMITSGMVWLPAGPAWRDFWSFGACHIRASRPLLRTQVIDRHRSRR